MFSFGLLATSRQAVPSEGAAAVGRCALVGNAVPSEWHQVAVRWETLVLVLSAQFFGPGQGPDRCWTASRAFE